jgi:hypothetical protein
MFKLPDRYRLRAELALQHLWVLSGDDRYIIKESSRVIQKRFTNISLVVVIIGVVCFISSFAFFEYAFDLPALVEFFLALFIAVVIGNLYVLLLYTITPLIFENRKDQPSDQQKYTLIGAFTIRIFFIVLIATSIAQPIGVLVLSRYTDHPIEEYKNKYLSEALAGSANATAAGDVNVKELTSKMESERRIVSSLLESSNFFVQRVRILASSNAFYWLIVVSIWALFFYPVYEKYNVRNHKRFYLQKKELESQIVTEAYSEFKIHYERIMNERLASYNSTLKHALVPVIQSIETSDRHLAANLYHELFTATEETAFEKFEDWLDPPFRTVRKKDERPIEPQKALLDSLYPSISQPGKS